MAGVHSVNSSVSLLVFTIVFSNIREVTAPIIGYKMPDGVICSNSYNSGGGLFNPGKRHFDECTNNRVYIEPDSYEYLYDLSRCEWYMNKDICGGAK